MRFLNALISGVNPSPCVASVAPLFTLCDDITPRTKQIQMSSISIRHQWKAHTGSVCYLLAPAEVAKVLFDVVAVIGHVRLVEHQVVQEAQRVALVSGPIEQRHSCPTLSTNIRRLQKRGGGEGCTGGAGRVVCEVGHGALDAVHGGGHSLVGRIDHAGHEQ